MADRYAIGFQTLEVIWTFKKIKHKTVITIIWIEA